MSMGLKPSRNTWYLVLGPNEALVLDISLQKEFRDKVIRNAFIQISRKAHSTDRDWAIIHRREQVQMQNVFIQRVYKKHISYANGERIIPSILRSSVQLLKHVWLFATPWTAGCQASLSITKLWGLLKLMSIKSVTPSKHLILCRPLFLLSSIFPSIRVFSSESVLHIRWPKYWSFSFSISPSNEYSELISFWIDWFYLLAVQGTLKSLQHHSSKASILQCSAFFMVQLSHPLLLKKP